MKFGRITLLNHEMRMVVYVGVERRLQTIIKGLWLTNRANNPNWEPWDCDIEAAAAEYAAAKILGFLWDGSYNTFKKADIEERIQIRHTKEINNSLIVRPKDKKNDIFILVIGSLPTFSIMGWITGKDAMQEKYKKNANDGPVAYFVPQSDLRPMNELIKE